MSLETVLLRPRPLARTPGELLLLPLLPVPKPAKHIPAELWIEILGHSLAQEHSFEFKAWGWSLLLVCKTFREIALPLIYAHVRIAELSSLQKFYDKLHAADQKWDSIRRIPYSTPGRWVQSLDLSNLIFESRSQALQLDSILTSLFPLTPCLSSLYINPSFILSRRALYSLAERDGAANLRYIGGLSYTAPQSPTPHNDPFVRLFQCCPNLEHVEIIGQGLEPLDNDYPLHPVVLPPMDDFQPLNLPKLRVLSMLSMHTSPLMLALLYSPLPVLKKLTLTPCDDLPFPNSLVSTFIATHGETLRSLLLFTPKAWPTRLGPSPESLLDDAPNLRHLSLEMPLPTLSISEPHLELQILSIPRPNASFWPVLERMLPYLPNLVMVRARDVRWLRKGISSMAVETGVQGEMRDWKRRLARRRIRLVDGDWNED
ncbi:hypothetical protein CC1G_06573 [Coprinopsis cinerea okayama7|uniref:F-box domain-containing protein n=1 Tax=Coprinopsis cinerea (strain Okayama-7 / 130 / ATCC MYA-4618 / FGSC 9003) TaxID=240176 RepID=A8N301_COPC7|nr:hypothetical protein CC1G_06573 [Coprinopsis cinerea okayama7\|eukprot:XP_001829236.1 hypothetical protein CC1G_06573 [Coprinopsis cinerea okayama7\